MAREAFLPGVQVARGVRIPWQAKAVVQSVLAVLPFGEVINHRLQRVNARRRGKAAQRQRAAEVVASVQNLDCLKPIFGSVVVEVGTGWDAMPTLALSAAGAKAVHTFDHRRHLRSGLMAEAEAALREWYPKGADRNTILYQAPADAARTGLPDASVDIFFSYAVLEHVPERTIKALIAEARRVLKPDGVFYALIGLHDHYHCFDSRVSKVNFLRYPEWLWALLVKNRISYHNRLRERDFLHALAAYGAEIIGAKSTIDPTDVEAIHSMKVNQKFARYSPDELAVTRTEIAARFTSRPA